MADEGLRYKLLIVRLKDPKEPVKGEYHTACIGWFKDEGELEQWAKENHGELAKC